MSTKISALPAATSVDGTEQLEINQGGTSRRITTAQSFQVIGNLSSATSGPSLTPATGYRVPLYKVADGAAYSATLAQVLAGVGATVPAGGAMGQALVKLSGTDYDVAWSSSVTSVAASGGTTGMSFSGSPITSSGTLTLTGTLVPANGGTGITSLGAGVAAWLGTPSSANLAAAIPDETGSGALVFATSPTLVTPALGTPTSGTLTNCTGVSLTTGIAGTLSIGNGGTGQTTASAAFDAIAPTTTRGDIIRRGASSNQRVGLGASGYLLGSDGTDATWIGFVPSGTGATTRAWQTKVREVQVSVKDFGAVGDCQVVSTNASMTSGAAILTTSSSAFAPADVGKTIYVPGAGASGAPLKAAISTYTSATQVTLNTTASTTISALPSILIFGTVDRAAIQAALDASRRVWFPLGDYLVDDVLYAQSSCEIIGEHNDQTIIRRVGTYGDTLRVGLATLTAGRAAYNAGSGTIKNISFVKSNHYDNGSVYVQGTTSAIKNIEATGAHVYIYAGQRFVVEDCVAANCRYGFKFESTSYPFLVRPKVNGHWDSDTSAMQEMAAGVYLFGSGSENIHMSGHSIGGSGLSPVQSSVTIGDVTTYIRKNTGPRDGVLIEVCEGGSISDGYLGGHARNNIRLSAGGSYPLSTIRIHDNHLDGAVNACIGIESAAPGGYPISIKITDNDYSCYGIGERFVEVINTGGGTQATTNLEIIGNFGQGTTKAPIYLTNTIGGIIAGNQVRAFNYITGYGGAWPNNTTSVLHSTNNDAAISSGIYITGSCSNVTIAPNEIGGGINDPVNGSYNYCQWGVYLNGSPTNIYVLDQSTLLGLGGGAAVVGSGALPTALYGVKIAGTTSGAVSLVAQAAAGTPTITLGTASGTIATAVPSPLSLSSTTGAVTWSTTANQILYSSASNTVTGLATANNGVLVTSAGGVPSIGSALPSAVQTNITSLGTITTGTWTATKIGLAYGGTNADLSATGGTSQVLKQVSAGAAITVGQLAASDLSNGTTGTGSVVLATTPTFASKITVNSGRSLFAGNSELYAIGFGYNSTRTAANQVAYFGATDSTAPDLVISNSGGGTIAYFKDDRTVQLPAISAAGFAVFNSSGVFASQTSVSFGLTSTSSSAGVGYATGAGGTVTQSTSKSTGVTLNTVTGTITMNNASLASATTVGFTLTNSSIAATDIVLVTIKSGGTANSYHVQVSSTAAGSCVIELRNTSGGSLSEAVVLSYAVIKGVAS